jgi:hypothetical protein
MPIAAGVLTIISAVISLLVFVGLVIAAVFTGGVAQGWFGYTPNTPDLNVATSVLVILAVISGIAGIFSLIGGIFALQRKHWGLALAGSIFAFFPTFILGVLAIIFTAISKNEFA